MTQPGSFLDALFAPTDPALRAAWEGQRTRAAIDELAEAQRRAVAATSAAAQTSTEANAVLYARVAQLEKNLASTALYARTLLQVLAQKGLVSAEEFGATLERLDLLDGVHDGR